MIRESLDNGKYSCGVFIDLQKAFDTVDHSILLNKMEHYGIKGISNKWFQSYLSGRSQFTTINGFDSYHKTLKYGVPQGSVLGPLLFLIYINDLHKALKYSTVHHFADDTNLLISDTSIKVIQKQINLDLKNLCNWLKANKISLNASKTEIIIFRHPNKLITHKKRDESTKCKFKLKIKIDGQKLNPSIYVKYLGVLIDQHLSWKYQVNELSTKLSRTIGMLSKIRHYVDIKTSIMIYHGIFSSILNYGSQIWGQSNSIQSKIEKIQNKAMRTLNFESKHFPVNSLCKILKFRDNIKLYNILFVHDCLKGNVPYSLRNSFTLVRNIHSYPTRFRINNQLQVPTVRTKLNGIDRIKFKSVQA